MSSFLHQLGPTLHVSKVMGLVHFNFATSNMRASKQLKTYATSMVLLNLTALVWMITLSSFYSSVVIYKTAAVLQIWGGLAYNALTLINAIKNCKNFCKILTQLLEWNQKFINFGHEDTQANSRTFRVVPIMTARVSLVVASMIWNYFLQNSPTVLYRFIFYSPLFVSTAFSQQIIAIVDAIRTKFVDLNATIENVNETSYLHQQLCKIIHLFNETFGFNLLMMFGVCFLNIVGSSYFFIVVLQWFKFRSVDMFMLTDSLFTVCNYSIDAFLVCSSCHKTIEEANKSEILIQTSDKRGRVEDNFMFALQIANEQVEFSAAGLFPINYTLVFSIIGGVTTYIVILLQFSTNKFEELV